MKKLLLLIVLIGSQLASFADYTGTVNTNQNDLNFTTINGYDLVSLPDLQYTDEIGAPQLPVKTVRILIPIDQMVSSININNTTIQPLSGNYNIYPVQTPRPYNP